MFNSKALKDAEMEEDTGAGVGFGSPQANATLSAFGLTIPSAAAADAAPREDDAKLEAGDYNKQVKRLLKIDGCDTLLNAALAQAGGDIRIMREDRDDTRWDRKENLIRVSSKKKGAELDAAILFELHNAANPHTCTDAIEARLYELSGRDQDLTGMDFIKVAQEMEKDEFESLKDYMAMVEGSDMSEARKKTMREKYEACLVQGQLDYDLYVQQNLKSDHTLGLARDQHANYNRGRPMASTALDALLPYEILNPGKYNDYVNDRLTTRASNQFQAILESEENRQKRQTTDDLFTDEPAEAAEIEVDQSEESGEDIAPEDLLDGLTFEEWMDEIRVLFRAEYRAELEDYPDAPFAPGFEEERLRPKAFYEKYLSRGKAL